MHSKRDKTPGEHSCELYVWKREGQGAPVLLLHGLTGSGAIWKPLLEQLPSVPALVPDLLGFGRSPKPSVSYDLNTQLECLAPLLSQHRPVAVVAHSMGAAVALGVLHRWPLVKRAVLISPATFASRVEARKAMRNAPILHRLSLRVPIVDRVLCEAACVLRPVLQPIAPLFARDLRPEIARAMLDHTWHSYSRSMDHLVTSGAVLHLLGGLHERVVILHGANDTTVPVPLVSRLDSRVRQLTVVPGDHLLLVRRPELVAAFVQEAISGL